MMSLLYVILPSEDEKTLPFNEFDSLINEQMNEPIIKYPIYLAYRPRTIPHHRNHSSEGQSESWLPSDAV